MRFQAALIAFLTALLFASGASANVQGIAVDKQLGLQEAATPVMERIVGFHFGVLVIITVITLVVLALLLWVMIRYNAKSNPNPSKFSHNTLVEVIWTAVPVIILVLIAVPSFRLLYFQDVLPTETTEEGQVVSAVDMTIKVTGNQWNWTYAYPDHGDFDFVASMVADEDIQPGQYRNLSTDLPLVVPAGQTVRLEVTASDVIHNWAMPAFGIKMDAIPGRLNETWFHVEQEGIYFGQCSELCGRDHAFMPIELHVVPEDVFNRWVQAAQDDVYTAPEILTAYYETQGETQLAALR